MTTQKEGHCIGIGVQAEAWKQLFRTHPLPILWIKPAGEIIRANPVAQRVFCKSLISKTLYDFFSGENLEEKLALTASEGTATCSVEMQIVGNQRLSAHLSLIALSRYPSVYIQVLVSCEIPPGLDQEAVKQALVGTLAEKRAKELSRATQQLRLEMLQRTRAELRTKQKTLEVDAAETKLAESNRQLLQADKMVNLGQMAAGITHEINNPLTYLNCNLHTLTLYFSITGQVIEAYQSVARCLESDHDYKEALKQASCLEEREDLSYIFEDGREILLDCQEGIQRIVEIVKSLQGFARKDDLTWAAVDLNAVMDGALKVVDHRLKSQYRVARDYGALPFVYCHEGQIGQIIVNLLVNALQAMPEGGTLILRTRAVTEAVELEVSDTGRGMSEELQRDIFSPFFTTKEPGEGTGLGLFVSHQIMQKHGGEIRVRSQEGVGSTFILHLPIGDPPG